MKTSIALLTSLACCLAVSRAFAADPVIYSQPYANYEDTTWGSYTAPQTTPATIYGSFVLTNSGHITVVQWQGTYIDHNTLRNNPTPPDATSFTIGVWSDNNGQPGSQITSQTVPIAACNQTSLGTVGFNAFNDSTTYQIAFYTYRAVLPTTFDATAGTRYWISIVGACSQSTPI